MPSLPPSLIFTLITSSILAGTIAAFVIMVAIGRAKPDHASTHIAPQPDISALENTAPPSLAPRTNGPSDLVQTLTKTFAQLSVGIAIFDEDHHLILFNPALMDMCEVPVESLSRRPTMSLFLDQLREQDMLPEPRDYPKWKERYEVMFNESGRILEELWSLPSGLTYRVTVQSHRNGTLSLLMEDISSELSVTRNIRARVRQNESILNSFEEPLCVFSGTGHLSFCNRAFERRWMHDRKDPIEKLRDIIPIWQDSTLQNAGWDRLEQYSQQVDPRQDWSFDAETKAGRRCKISVSSVIGGGTMVRFQQTNPGRGSVENTSVGPRTAAISRLQVGRSRSIFATDGTGT